MNIKYSVKTFHKTLLLIF